MMELKIEDNVVVPYPADELKSLKKIVKMKGVVGMIEDSKIASGPTIRRIVKTGQGQYKIVSGLREFVKTFNVAVAS